MTNDMQDRLLTWITKQERTIKLDEKMSDFNEGRYMALMDVKVFLMTGGKLQEPTQMPHRLEVKAED